MWAEDPHERILMIAPTAGDVRDVMMEGPSGLMRCYPPGRQPFYEPSKRLVTFPSGAVGILRSADEPERLRGPQFTKFWADEIAAWNYPQEAWDQIMFGFRLKTARLQGLITSTPKAIQVITDLLESPHTVVSSGSSYENRKNLSQKYYDTVIKPYENTRLGRQEIYAEVLMDVPGALWTDAMIDPYRIQLHQVRDLVRTVVGVDPAVTHTTESDLTGIVAAGVTRYGRLIVLEDASERNTPRGWALTVLRMFKKWNCDRIVGEVNNGGDLVEQNIRMALKVPEGMEPPPIPYRAVWASQNKQTRAGPVAAYYEKGLAHHLPGLKELEKEMCRWVPGDPKHKSPNRMDALVWAAFDLVVEPMQAGILSVTHRPEISPV